MNGSLADSQVVAQIIVKLVILLVEDGIDDLLLDHAASFHRCLASEMFKASLTQTILLGDSLGTLAHVPEISHYVCLVCLLFFGSNPCGIYFLIGHIVDANVMDDERLFRKGYGSRALHVFNCCRRLKVRIEWEIDAKWIRTKSVVCLQCECKIMKKWRYNWPTGYGYPGYRARSEELMGVPEGEHNAQQSECV